MAQEALVSNFRTWIEGMPMTRDRKTLINRALVIVLTVWGLAVITPDFARIFTDYGTLGFEADNDGVVTSMDGPPASVAGISANDCIDLKNTALSDLLAVFGGMGGMTYVRPDLEVKLFIEPHPCTPTYAGATPRLLKAQSTPLTSASRLLLGLVQILGVFFIGIGALLVWQRPSAMTWGFFLYGLWFNPGQFFVFYAQLQRFPYLLLAQEILQSAAQAVGYAGFVIFALRFPRNVAEPQWRYVERALPALVLILFVLQLASFGTSLGFKTEVIGRWSYIGGYAVDLGVLLILRLRRKSQPPEDQRERVGYTGRAGSACSPSYLPTATWLPRSGFRWSNLSAHRDRASPNGLVIMAPCRKRRCWRFSC